jgi:hypothetical protein
LPRHSRARRHLRLQHRDPDRPVGDALVAQDKVMNLDRFDLG